MTTRTRVAGILTALTMTALMAACSTSDSGGDAVSESSASDRSSGGSSSGGADSDGAGSDGADSSGGVEAPGLVGREVGEDDGSSGSVATPATERSIIATGAVSLTSEDVGETRREVQRIVDAEGGDITEENTESDDGEASYSRLVIRVPSPAFGPTMVALEEAGELRSSTRGSDDVTTQVIDTGVRVRAQEASLERVELLLAEADTLKDIIWIESQLTSRQAELDSLKSQQSWLDDQTSLSTITVDISTPSDEVDEEQTDDSPAGFVAGLKGGMTALGASLAAVATILGALLPFAVLALVLALPVWLVVRRRRGPAVPQAPAA